MQTIDSIAKLLNWLSMNKPNDFHKTYFRGESKNFLNTAFKPSLFRNNKWLFNETAMYYDVLQENPVSFEKDTTVFERLVRMQHFGLPTRLLDITSNPLVALYFSCNDNFKSDGIFYAVTTKKSELKTQNDESVKFLSKVVLLGDFDNELTSRYGITTFLDNRKKYTEEYMQAMIEENESKKDDIFSKLWSLTETGVFKFLNEGLSDNKELEKLNLFDRMIIVKAPKNNFRQFSQSGDFLMFGNNASLANGNSVKNFTINKLRVPASKKLEILEELELININQYSLFPELSSLCELAKRSHSRIKFNYPNNI